MQIIISFFFFVLTVMICLWIFLSTTWTRNIRAKNILIYSLLILPFFSAFIKIPVLGTSLTWSFERYFILLLLIISVGLLIDKNIKIRISKIAIWFGIYVLLTLLNRIYNGYVFDLKQGAVFFSDYLHPLIFIFVIDNLDFTQKDIQVLKKVLTIVALGTFIVIVIQETINPMFYSGYNYSDLDQSSVIEEHLTFYGTLYRNFSIYHGMRVNNHGWAIICLNIYFISLYIQENRPKYLAIVGLLLLSGFLTYTRYIWVGLLIGTFCYLFFRFRKRFLFLSFFSVSVVFILIYFFSTDAYNSNFFQERVLAKSYESRLFDPQLYFSRYFLESPLLGFGINSSESMDVLQFRSVFHNLWLNIVFRNGLIGIVIFLTFLYYIFKQGKEVYQKSGNPLFIIFVIIYILINLLSAFSELDFYGYFIILLLLAMNRDLYIVQPKSQQILQE